MAVTDINPDHESNNEIFYQINHNSGLVMDRLVGTKKFWANCTGQQRIYINKN